MTKISITIEIDVDFQKFFDEIPEGLYRETGFEDNDGKVDDGYISYAVGGVLSKSYQSRLANQMDWLARHPKQYEFAKHHLEIDTEIAKQISEKAKIKIL